MADNELDVRQLRKPDKHPTIFAAYPDLPVGGSFLYVEPLYNQTSNGSGGTYPILVRVIVVYGDKIGYGATLADALSDIIDGNPTGSTIQNGALPNNNSTSTPSSPAPSTSSSPSTAASSAPPVATGQRALLNQLNTAYNKLMSAYSSGDFAKIGAAQAKVNSLVAQYLAAYGSAPTGGSRVAICAIPPGSNGRCSRQ